MAIIRREEIAEGLRLLRVAPESDNLSARNWKTTCNAIGATNCCLLPAAGGSRERAICGFGSADPLAAHRDAAGEPAEFIHLAEKPG
jgi:hypothetical protein